mmetsp:Transcript_45527/g.145173  ORF Transcript_45527/g.145173 Transcript_45527/m.145173 type:complete len:209 (+) Transcript_45527:1729-2355(+)
MQRRQRLTGRGGLAGACPGRASKSFPQAPAQAHGERPTRDCAAAPEQALAAAVAARAERGLLCGAGRAARTAHRDDEGDLPAHVRAVLVLQDPLRAQGPHVVAQHVRVACNSARDQPCRRLAAGGCWMQQQHMYADCWRHGSCTPDSHPGLPSLMSVVNLRLSGQRAFFLPHDTASEPAALASSKILLLVQPCTKLQQVPLASFAHGR